MPDGELAFTSRRRNQGREPLSQQTSSMQQMWSMSLEAKIASFLQLSRNLTPASSFCCSRSPSDYGRFHSRTSPPFLTYKSAVCCSQASLSAGKMEQHSIPVLSTEEAMSKLKANVQNSTQHESYGAMYSSVLEGITTDAALMVLPIDDHMVHRGHGVFDTAVISKGYLYELDAHLDRLLRSASMAKIIPPYSRQMLRDILVKTVAVSNVKEGFLRYWLSAGPGGFSLSSKECAHASFYAIVIHDSSSESHEPVKVITSSVPMKPPMFATMKSVNYLPNALSLLEAEEQGAFAGIWVDDEGFVAEGPNMNVAFVSKTGELIMPGFDKILSGCTAKRVLALAQESLNKLEGQNGNLKEVTVRAISVEEGKDAAEMMLIGSKLSVLPVVQWDEQQIGNGKPGPISLALKALMEDDILNGPLTHREPVPYEAVA
eukprot:c16194_g1_i1 orf=308-1600(-)